MAKDAEMTFFDHLEELRWRIVRTMAAILIFATAAFIAKDFIFTQVLFGPKNIDFPTYKFLCLLVDKWNLSKELCIQKVNYTIINTEMAGQFMVHIKTSLAIGLIFAFPYLVWEIWLFIRPGLYEKEIKASRFAILFSSFLFFIGVAFGYFILTPMSINFLSTYSISETVNNTFTLTNYIGFLTTFVLANGIMFQLPVVVYLLAKIGLVSAGMMREYRKHAVVVIFILAAIITPADISSMVLVAFPLMILYEISIYIAKKTYKPPTI